VPGPKDSAFGQKGVFTLPVPCSACRDDFYTFSGFLRQCPSRPVFSPLPSETLFLGPISSGQKFPLFPCSCPRHRRIICPSSPRQPSPPLPNPNHCHELDHLSLHGCNRLSSALFSLRSSPGPFLPHPCFSRAGTKNHSRSPWTVLTLAAGLPRQKMMAWIRSASTLPGLVSQLPSQTYMTSGCRES
jgi:hypothetical protein